MSIRAICHFIFSLCKLFDPTEFGFPDLCLFLLTQRAKLLNLISLMWQKPVDSGSERVTALILYPFKAYHDIIEAVPHCVVASQSKLVNDNKGMIIIMLPQHLCNNLFSPSL